MNPGETPRILDRWSRIARRIRVPLSFVLGIAYVWLARPTRASILAGGLILIPGLLLRALAAGYVQKDRQLTTSGPYAYTRNPLYVGSLLLAGGFALAARSPVILGLLVLMFVLIYVPVIAGEERYLRQTFEGYADYAHNVPRLWLRLTPYNRSSGQFSSALYRKHREYNSIIGCAAVLLILLIKLMYQSPG